METDSTSRLEVHYTLERADAKAFATHVYRTVPRLRFFVLRQSLIFTLVCLLVFRIGEVPFRLGIPIALVLGLIFHWLYLCYLMWWATRRTSKTPGWVGNHFLAIEPHAIEAKSEGIEATVDWKHIDRIESKNQYIYFFLSPHQALVIPKRAFAGEQEAQQFLQTARLYWQTARGSGNQRVNPEDR